MQGYNPKESIYNNFIAIDNSQTKKTEDIFEAVEQVGNSKFDNENSLYKKTSYTLKDGFKFAFYIESNYRLDRIFQPKP